MGKRKGGGRVRVGVRVGAGREGRQRAVGGRVGGAGGGRRGSCILNTSLGGGAAPACLICIPRYARWIPYRLLPTCKHARLYLIYMEAAFCFIFRALYISRFLN